ncbi:MAG TPA: hypothetical protein VG125_29305 [Pirellulales bacterium]|jgi:hypothetical protein|nr:hypothetical protein [Pirellulales bacterium]
MKTLLRVITTIACFCAVARLAIGMLSSLSRYELLWCAAVGLGMIAWACGWRGGNGLHRGLRPYRVYGPRLAAPKVGATKSSRDKNFQTLAAARKKAIKDCTAARPRDKSH